MKKEKEAKVLTPAQERRKQFLDTFFATTPVRIGFGIITVMAFVRFSHRWQLHMILMRRI